MLCVNHYNLALYHKKIKARKVSLSMIRAIGIGLFSDTDKCIIWRHYINNEGYGSVSYKGKDYPAHRFTLGLKTGHVQRNKMALHKPVICHNRACVNPRHLYWGDHRDNHEDSVKDKTFKVGESSHASKITESQAIEILKDTRSFKQIAEEYGLSISNVSGIKSGRIWKHLKVSPLRSKKSESFHKLKDEDVIYIFKSKEKGVVLAKKFNVSKSVISCIKTGKTYSKITDKL